MKSVLLTALMAIMLLSGCASRTSESSVVINTVNVGRITNIELEKVTVKPSIAVVLAGSIAGGAIGSKFGSGSGKKIATGIGALAGASATNSKLTKQYNKIVYTIFYPSRNHTIKVASTNLGSGVKKNDIVVVYNRNKKITIDSYGQYNNSKFKALNDKFNTVSFY